MRNQRLGKAIAKILNYQIKVELEKPVFGYWDGGAKQCFTFSPEVATYSKGSPNIKWGSWGANHWFKNEVGASAESHLGNMRKKLLNNFARKEIKAKVTIVKKEVR